MKIHRSYLLLLLFLLVFVSISFSRDITAKKTSREIVIDGILGPVEWQKSLFQSNFIQSEPKPGSPSREQTFVAVQFDDKNIYIAFFCRKSYPDPIIARQTRRDQLIKNDDLVAVMLDTYDDDRSAYLFLTNGLNTQSDARISDDAKYMDFNWDGNWEARTTISDSGYTVEISIPFNSIRFDPYAKKWGVNFGRFIPKWLETSYWAGPTNEDFRVSKYGDLIGLKLPAPASELHIIPYATTRYETFSNQKWDDMEGMDLEFRYRNNLTANFTFQPDFATVEGDREQINMTRWELSFPEKRKFFLEGNELFQNRIRAFYSRRIGEINFGGKAIGKTGRNTFAVIGLNAKKVADNPNTSSDESFPEYNIGIFRLKRDILKSSTIGMMYIEKNWNGGYNRLLSMDGIFHFPGNFHFTCQFVAAAPGNWRESYGGFIRLARENNIYHYHLRYTELGENFRDAANGIGFIRDDDRRELDSSVEYKFWVRNSWIEFIEYGSNYNIYWGKNSGILRSWQIVEEGKIYLKNKWSFGIDAVREYELFEKGFHNYDVELELGYNTEEWSFTTLTYQFGKNYDLDYRMITGEKNIKLSDKFSLEYEIRNLKFTPDPEQESTWLNIATLSYQFTPDLFIRLFAQHRTQNNHFYVYGIFGWRFKLPSSAVYLVYTRDDFDEIGLSRMHNEIFFFKLAYDFSL